MSGFVKITTVITNVRAANQAFKLMDEATRIRVRDAVQETVLAVEAKARQNVPVSTPAERKAKNRPGPGELRDTIRSVMAIDGMAGYVLAGFGKLARRSRATKPPKLGPVRLKTFLRQQQRAALKAQRELGVYAMVVEYGSPGRGIPGSRYMSRAKESERQNHINRIRAALNHAANSVHVGNAGGERRIAA